MECGVEYHNTIQHRLSSVTLLSRHKLQPTNPKVRTCTQCFLLYFVQSLHYKGSILFEFIVQLYVIFSSLTQDGSNQQHQQLQTPVLLPLSSSQDWNVHYRRHQPRKLVINYIPMCLPYYTDILYTNMFNTLTYSLLH